MFSDEDKILIKTCMIQKCTGGMAPKKLMIEFPKKSVEQKWTVMQRHVYQRQIHSVYELKQQLIDVWCGLEQSIFDEASGEADFERVSMLKCVLRSTCI